MKTFVKQYPQALATPIVNLYLEKTKNLVNKQGNIVKHDEYQKLGLQELITKQIKKTSTIVVNLFYTTLPKIVVQYTTAFGKVFITPHLLSIIILYLCPHKINSYLLPLI